MNEKAPALSDLEAQWLAAYQSEQDAKNLRNKIAQKILEHPEVIESFNAKEFGARTIGALELKREEKRSWDQAQVIALTEKLSPSEFPFKIEFKEDRKASAALAQNSPAIWALFLPALSTEPSNILIGASRKAGA